MLMTFLYLMGQADAIRDMFFIFGGVTAAFIGLCLLIYGISAIDYDQPWGPVAYFWQNGIYKKFLAACIMCFFIGVLFPSTKTIMIMGGGYTVVELSKTETARNLASSSVKIVEKYLANQLEKLEKEETKTNKK